MIQWVRHLGLLILVLLLADFHRIPKFFVWVSSWSNLSSSFLLLLHRLRLLRLLLLKMFLKMQICLCFPAGTGRVVEDVDEAPDGRFRYSIQAVYG